MFLKGCEAVRFSLVLFFLVWLTIRSVSAQEVYVNIKSAPIYDFIDEMSNAHFINANSVAKPYSRSQIAMWLHELDQNKELLNKRQQQDLNFFLRDYNKELLPGKFKGKRLDLFYYKDSLFTFSLNPILGINYFINDSGSFYHRWGGIEAFAYIGKHLGIYAALRDNYESIRMTEPSYLNTLPGEVYKVDGVSRGGDYSEMTGGITYSWKWGSVGIIKDRFTWGDNYYGSNIISDKAPSFAQLKFDLHPAPWIDFHYQHGWLVSEVIDSSNSYWTGSGTRLTYRPKYLASNLLTLSAWKYLKFSIGNSIVYSDVTVQPAYLIPVFFYKSVDHSQSGANSNYLGNNSQMFFNISSRQIKNLHLFTSVFVDEISFSNMWNEDEHSNFISFKVGAKLSNFPLKNVQLVTEYTRTNPITYRHYIPTATFSSNEYNMGHYLGDNAQEIAVGIIVKPISKLTAKADWIFAQKGEEYPYTGQSGTDGDGLGHPFLDKAYWQSSAFILNLSYQPLNDCYLFAGLQISDQHGALQNTYSMPYYIGKQTTINFGMNVGF